MNQTIYDKLGGAPALELAVNLFYRSLLDDDRVAGFFQGVDIDGQIEKQKAFLTMVLGGPSKVRSADLRESHSQLDINDLHVDVILEHLAETLRELGVDEELVSQVVVETNAFRNDVLNR